MTENEAIRAPRLFLSCGEPSGDRYGACLVNALRRRVPGLQVAALGGAALAAAGAEIVQPMEPLAVMGFGEIAGALPALLAARRRVWRHLAAGQVDLCVPIDFPGFNLRVARQARRRGIPVFYLVAPQLWAWAPWRIGGVRRGVDRLGCLLPFEPAWFAARGVPAVALGHPLVDAFPAARVEADAVAREARLADERLPLTLGVLPGSRRQELARLLPPLLGAAAELQRRLAPRRVACVVSAAPGVDARPWRARLAGVAEVTDEPLTQLLPRLDLALVCSGTASLEVALAGVPHEVVYRTSPFNYAIARRLVNVRRIGLANLVLGEDLAREHLQDEVTPERLARALSDWVAEPGRRRALAAGVARLRDRLGPPGFWERAADAALALLAAGRGRGE